ncbi:MAG: TlpA disulfide reductase family protein [Vicingaceae bacterium]|nr:TlpA disulfide reductase family protein [Vicingaceae bacterium]
MFKINDLLKGAYLLILMFLFSCQLLKEPAGKIMSTTLPPPVIEKENVSNDINDKPINNYPIADYNLVVKNLDGTIVKLENYKDKVIFLNFWATWCLPCVAELPSINRLYNELKNEDIVFLLISNEKVEKVTSYKEKKKYDVPFHILDSTGYIPKMYYSQSIPTTFLINKKGEIIRASTGAEDWDDEAFINELKKHL